MRNLINIILESALMDDLLVNPTARQIEREAQSRDLRGLAYGNTIVLWSAMESIHRSIREKLGIDEDDCTSFYVSRVCEGDFRPFDVTGLDGRSDWIDHDYLYSKIRSVYLFIDPDDQSKVTNNLALKKVVDSTGGV